MSATMTRPRTSADIAEPSTIESVEPVADLVEVPHVCEDPTEEESSVARSRRIVGIDVEFRKSGVLRVAFTRPELRARVLEKMGMKTNADITYYASWVTDQGAASIRADLASRGSPMTTRTCGSM